MGQIIHGNKNFGYAPIENVGGVSSFGTPQMIAGLIGCSIEVEQNSTKIYADDAVHCVVKGAKVRTANASFRNIPKDYAKYLGFKENVNGMLTDTGDFPNHCIFFETTEENCDTGKKAPILHYLYNVKGSEPTQESESDEEEITAEEIQVEYDAQVSSFVADDDGEFLQYGYIERNEENKTLYDTFKSAVILPTSPISASV